MNRIGIKTKIGLVNKDKYSWNHSQLRDDKLFDTEEDAKKYAHEHFLFSDVGEVAVLEGDVSAGKCKACPVDVTITKYKDFDGKLWDKEEDCEISNACHVINEMAGETVFEYKKALTTGMTSIRNPAFSSSLSASSRRSTRSGSSTGRITKTS